MREHLSQGFAEGKAKEIWSPVKSAMKHLKSLSYNVPPKAGDQSVCKTSLCPPPPPQIVLTAQELGMGQHEMLYGRALPTKCLPSVYLVKSM